MTHPNPPAIGSPPPYVEVATKRFRLAASRAVPVREELEAVVDSLLEAAAEHRTNASKEITDDSPLSATKLSPRTVSILETQGVETVGQVRRMRDAELLELDCMGLIELGRIRAVCGRAGK